MTYLASWTCRASKQRITKHVAEAELDALREAQDVLDLRGILVGSAELPTVTSKPSGDLQRWLQGGRGWPSNAQRCGRTDLEDLAEDIVRLLPPEQGGDPTLPWDFERRSWFGAALAVYALATAGQPGTVLERARLAAAGGGGS